MKDLLTIDDVAQMFEMNREEVLHLTKKGVFKSVVDSPDSPELLRYPAEDILGMRFKENQSSIFDMSDIRFPHRRFIVYLLAMFGLDVEKINKYLQVVQMWPLEEKRINQIAQKMLEVAPDDQFIQAFHKNKHRDTAGFDVWAARLGVDDLIADRTKLTVDVIRNRNLRVMVETAHSAGISSDKIKQMVNSVFNKLLSIEEIDIWNRYLYDVGNIEPAVFTEMIRSYYGKHESPDALALRIKTQCGSPAAVSELQRYYIVNFQHEWQELWEIVAGMTFGRLVDAVAGGKSIDAKTWADLIEQSLKHKPQPETFVDVPLSTAEDGVVIDDVTSRDVMSRDEDNKEVMDRTA